MISISAKTQFRQRDDWVKHHQELVRSEWFLMALASASQEYKTRLSKDTYDLTTSAVRFQRIVGVEEFLTVLLNLAESPETSKHQRDPSALEPTD